MTHKYCEEHFQNGPIPNQKGGAQQDRLHDTPQA